MPLTLTLASLDEVAITKPSLNHWMLCLILLADYTAEQQQLFAERVNPTAQFGSQTVTVTLCTAARNSNGCLLPLLSKAISFNSYLPICSTTRADVPHANPGSTRLNPGAWLCRGWACFCYVSFYTSIPLAKSQLLPPPSPAMPSLGLIRMARMRTNLSCVHSRGDTQARR